MSTFHAKAFQRRQEDFICDHCCTRVRGNGYTNHCPRCLYSKHVDIQPGDRRATCGGLMEPVRLAYEHQTEKLTHQCLMCGYQKKNKLSPNDGFEALLMLARRQVEREGKAI